MEVGPPLSRIFPFITAMMCLGNVVAAFVGLPSVSTRTIPLFVLPVVLLASKRKDLVAAGFGIAGLACAVSATAVFWIPNFQSGQMMRGFTGWGFIAVMCLYFARMTLSRGIRT
jgi:hypothetical protein